MPCLVLLVEDDEDIRESMRGELEELGCEVLPASSGRSALHLLKKGMRPDFIILDLLMPRMTGTELLRALKSDAVFATIPVVLMSASRVSAVVGEGGTTQHVLHKPLRRVQLEQIVHWFGGTAGLAGKRSEPA